MCDRRPLLAGVGRGRLLSQVQTWVWPIPPPVPFGSHVPETRQHGPELGNSVPGLCCTQDTQRPWLRGRSRDTGWVGPPGELCLSFPRPQGWGSWPLRGTRSRGEACQAPLGSRSTPCWQVGRVQRLAAGGGMFRPRGPCTARPGWSGSGVMASLAELTESAWSLGGAGGVVGAVDGEENQDSEAGGTPKIPGVFPPLHASLGHSQYFLSGFQHLLLYFRPCPASP